LTLALVSAGTVANASGSNVPPSVALSDPGSSPRSASSPRRCCSIGPWASPAASRRSPRMASARRPGPGDLPARDRTLRDQMAPSGSLCPGRQGTDMHEPSPAATVSPAPVG